MYNYLTDSITTLCRCFNSYEFIENQEKNGYSLTVLKDIKINPEFLKISYEVNNLWPWPFNSDEKKMLAITYCEKLNNDATVHKSKITISLPFDADPDTMDANITDDGLVITVEKKKDSE